MPSPDDSASLRIPPGTPMLVARRLTRDATGRAPALEETRLSPEDAQLAYRLTPTDREIVRS
jgi:DNA-binding GntR family transcriptional regulator